MWMFGPKGVVNPTNSYEQQFCNNHFNFNVLPVDPSPVYGLTTVSTCGTAFSDKTGELIFYTDGLSVFNRMYSPMPNGSGLNPGEIADEWAAAELSYPSVRGALILPALNSDSLFYIFHNGVVWDSGGSLGSYSNSLYYSLVDLSLQSGLGDVREKNHFVVQDTIIGGGGMAACKHANGRDWWLIVQEAFTNCFYRFLLTPQGLDTLEKQCIGDTLHFNQDRGSNSFTPDGTKYIWSNPFEHLSILNFNRCTGEFSAFRRIYVVDSLTEADPTLVIADGVAISPNSRFLYLSTGSELRQYDLLTNDVAGSEVIIANTFKDEKGCTVWLSQLAPDGKIYLNKFQDDTILHVINDPNQLGSACNFERNALHLPCLDPYTLPYYPNYRLGPLLSSGCDTLSLTAKSIDESPYIIGIYPNPATDYTILDYANMQQRSDRLHLEVINAIGEVVYETQLAKSSTQFKIETTLWEKGLYHVNFKDDGKIISKARFVKSNY